MRLHCYIFGCGTDHPQSVTCASCGCYIESAEWEPVPDWSPWRIREEIRLRWKYRQILHRCECGKFIWFKHYNSKCSRECFDRFLPF